MKPEGQPGGTLVERVMEDIRQRIARRNLTPGLKLPSIRSLAERTGVSKSTVVEAYERLVAEGVIRSHPGSGFFVATPLAPLALTEIAPRIDRIVDPIWLTRQQFLAKGSLTPGNGSLPASWMPDDALRRALRTVTRDRDSASLFNYDTPAGLAQLRQLLSARLADQGIAASPGQIILTESDMQATDLLCRFLIEPGDTVVLDDPGYFNFHALLRAHRVNVVGVPMTPTGPDISRFSEVLSRHKPRLYITNSALHNPTGAAVSPVTMHRVLKLAEQHDLIIIEDDIFGDFENTPSPRYAAFDGLERVIRVGSFSKNISSAIRCGYIVTRPDWVDNLIDLKIATSLGNGRFPAAVICNVLKSSGYRKHMETLRTRLAQAMAETTERLKAIGIIPWLEPNAGMFLWCRLPGNLDATELARRAQVHNLALAPGDAFSPARNARNYLRFNVAKCDDRRIFELLEMLMNEQAGAATTAA